jgi:putative addiction module component (TIGR02574 family)
MSGKVQELFEKASRLAPEEREELVRLLLESLEKPRDPAIEAAWAAEIRRRMSAYRAEHVKTVSWDDLRAHLHRADR